MIETVKEPRAPFPYFGGKRERIWLSPGCIREEQDGLFDLGAPSLKKNRTEFLYVEGMK